MATLKTLASIFSLLVLAACGAMPEKLTRPKAPEQIVVADKMSITTTNIFGDVKWEYVALPGTYRAERIDAHGVYFFGPDRSIVQISSLFKNQPRLKVGGIYIPNDSALSPRIFYIFESDVYTTDSIDNYVLQRTVTSATLPGTSPVGAGTGAVAIGNSLGGAAVNAMIEAGVGRIETFGIDMSGADAAKLRASRGPLSDAAKAASQ